MRSTPEILADFSELPLSDIDELNPAQLDQLFHEAERIEKYADELWGADDEVDDDFTVEDDIEAQLASHPVDDVIPFHVWYADVYGETLADFPEEA